MVSPLWSVGCCEMGQSAARPVTGTYAPCHAFGGLYCRPPFRAGGSPGTSCSLAVGRVRHTLCQGTVLEHEGCTVCRAKDAGAAPTLWKAAAPAATLKKGALQNDHGDNIALIYVYKAEALIPEAQRGCASAVVIPQREAVRATIAASQQGQQHLRG